MLTTHTKIRKLIYLVQFSKRADEDREAAKSADTLRAELRREGVDEQLLNMDPYELEFTIYNAISKQLNIS